MAQRRMFSPKIVGSDAFLDMPTSSQLLYFHLGMEADDDGFINPRKIMRMVGANEDDLKVLVGKRFVIPFENGVVVIKHWKINNLIRKDFFRETIYTEQKKLLITKENGAYTESVNNPLTIRSRRLGKDRLGKDRLGKDRLGKDTLADKPPQDDLERKELIKFFIQNINPHLKYNNNTENKACEELLNTYGLVKVKEALGFLEQRRKTDKFLPTITTPYQLLTKWAAIKQHLETKQPKIWKSSRLLPSLQEPNIK